MRTHGDKVQWDPGGSREQVLAALERSLGVLQGSVAVPGRIALEWKRGWRHKAYARDQRTKRTGGGNQGCWSLFGRVHLAHVARASCWSDW